KTNLIIYIVSSSRGEWVRRQTTLPFHEGKYLLASPKGEGFTHSKRYQKYSLKTTFYFPFFNHLPLPPFLLSP
ncbi:MAG: hypothetical protein LUG18_03030, partial [Candidatus Azobacteroides sp.]|nr:hypothetical protein [Candidatus Azobacteroides sp.]